MIVPCEVLEELTENFVGKRGPRSIPLWVCLDRTPDGGALRNTFDYEVNADEQEKLAGKVAADLWKSSLPKYALVLAAGCDAKGGSPSLPAKSSDANGKR